MIQTANDYNPTFCGKWLTDSKRKSKRKIYSDFVSLDTETSHNHNPENPVGWVYQWCFAVGDDVVIGRKPSELVDALERVAKHIGASEQNVILVYVHNLFYDMTYLRPFLLEKWSKPKMLAIANHKFISYTLGPFEFRCSYKLSNRSLEKWCSDLATEHKKMVGAVDYETIHTQAETLTETDWAYQIEDVLTLRECIQKQLKLYGDTLATVPLTSTGYVRRECKKHYREDRKNRKRFLNGKINGEIYTMLTRAFSGGLTHGNRFYMEKTVIGNIAHRDFTSHYPSCQKCYDFPIGRFCLYSDKGLTVEQLQGLENEYCYLAEIIIRDCCIKNKDVVLPVISESKIQAGQVSRCEIEADNGRVLECKGIFSLVVTELDFYWINRLYDFGEIFIGKVYISKKGKLPKYLIDTVDEFFFSKSDIKEREKAETDKQKKIELFIDLLKSKNSLNGIYGMTATKIVRESYTINDLGDWIKQKPTDINGVIEAYYKNENSFMQYQFGVWTTAHARYQLLYYIYDVIIANGGEYLYCDTDSCFYITNEICEKAVEDENVRRRTIGDEKEYYITTGSGKKVYYNQFTFEEYSEEFRFLHAKCYAFVTKGELKCVIAGVSAYEDSTRQYSREDELGEIDNLKDGFVFRRCGGVTVKYDDTSPIRTYTYRGEELEVATACIIEKGEKTLNNEMTLFDEWKGWEVNG